jgi:hypothetical protein
MSAIEIYLVGELYFSRLDRELCETFVSFFKLNVRISKALVKKFLKKINLLKTLND